MIQTMDSNPTRHPVTCDVDGKTYRGNYWVAGKILTVSTSLGGKSNLCRDIPVEALAKQLLHALAKEGKADVCARQID